MSGDIKQMRYNDPTNGVPSDVDKGTGRQINTEYWHKASLIEAAKEMYFAPLATAKNMPKNHGKKISFYHYMDILNDANVNDQGLDASGAVTVNGNLYGSSKDVNTVFGKLPLLGETGGRVNRVGISRKVIEGEIFKLGFHTSFTKEALMLDTDNQMYGHISREMVRAANEINEDMIQIDLIRGAGVVRFCGAATATAECTGEGNLISEVTYDDLQRLDMDLTHNRTPLRTKVITGSRNVGTTAVAASRFLHHGIELLPTLSRMTDHFGNQAYIPVEKYAYSGIAGANQINGEHGKIGSFRLIQVPEMMGEYGAGATATSANAGYRITGSKYDVYPMLCIGEDSFSTVGFQTDGTNVKFRIKYVAPEADGAYSRDDPFGETGYMSIKWWYGTVIQRPERLGLIKTVARA